MDADVIIVGAGRAGLSAALVLARSCRTVLVFDHGRPRNGSALALHGYLTRDGISPHDFRATAREELARYDSVRVIDLEVTDAVCKDGEFRVTTVDGARFGARKLLLATGVADHLPEIPGLREMYGKSVFHCPYCDGYELRGQPLAVYGCEGNDGQLERIVFDAGAPLERRAMFFTTGQAQRSHLAEALGCPLNEKGTVRTGPYQTTHLQGLYVAGDASRAVQWVIVAAAEGAEAAYSINQDFIKEATATP